jgi:hypothetical protein
MGLGTEGAVMARKKSEQPAGKTTPVKIDTALVRRAKLIAGDRGLTLSGYLSDVIRSAVDRDWAKFARKAVEAEEEGTE